MPRRWVVTAEEEKSALLAGWLAAVLCDVSCVFTPWSCEIGERTLRAFGGAAGAYAGDVVDGDTLGLASLNSVLDLGEEQSGLVVDDPQLGLEDLYGQALGHLAHERVQDEVEGRLVEGDELGPRKIRCIDGGRESEGLIRIMPTPLTH